MPYRSPNSSADSWLRLPTAAARSPATARSFVNAPAMPPVARMPQPIVSAIAPPLESIRRTKTIERSSNPSSAGGPAGGGADERLRLVREAAVRHGERDADPRDVLLAGAVERGAVRQGRPPLLRDGGAGVRGASGQVPVAPGGRHAVAAACALMAPGAPRVLARVLGDPDEPVLHALGPDEALRGNRLQAVRGADLVEAG